MTNGGKHNLPINWIHSDREGFFCYVGTDLWFKMHLDIEIKVICQVIVKVIEFLFALYLLIFIKHKKIEPDVMDSFRAMEEKRM